MTLRATPGRCSGRSGTSSYVLTTGGSRIGTVPAESAFVAHNRPHDAATVAPESELRTLLQDHGVTDLFICGLATDFAVQVWPRARDEWPRRRVQSLIVAVVCAAACLPGNGVGRARPADRHCCVRGRGRV